MSFHAGATFIHAEATELKPHLWFVLSDSNINPSRVVIANFTTWDGRGDSACIVEAGEHPFVTHKTYVRYRDARIVSVAKLEELRQQGLLHFRENLSEGLLERVRKGADESQFLKNAIREYLTAQGLI